MTPPWPRRRRFAMALIFAAGCAAPSVPGGEPASTGSSDVLTRLELSTVEDLNALEAVRRLRPNWLRYRGRSVLTGPGREGLRIYLDGAFFGDGEALSRLQPQSLEELRFLDSRQATLRFGTGHTVGAILARTRRHDA